jgi:hypothetical protein
MLANERLIFNYKLSRARQSVECAFGILKAKFKIIEGPVFCKEETLNSIIKATVVLCNFIIPREGLFFEGAGNYAVNHILNEDDGGRQRLSRPQRLRNQLTDYFLTLIS